MKVFSFADDETGEFSRKRAGGTRLLPGSIPAGHIAVEGNHDRHCRRFDLPTGEVVDYQPPAPDADHEWTGNRWELKPEVRRRNTLDKRARQRLLELDMGKIRPLSELLLEDSTPEVKAAARTRIADIEAQMVELRKDLKKDG